MQRLQGHIGIGHVRYPTAGSSSKAESQPFYVNSPYGLSIAHNGNLTNASNLRKILSNKYHRHMNTQSDSEILLNILAVELTKYASDISIEGNPHLDIETVFKAITALNSYVKGGYACVSMISGYGLLAFRDPNGIRPLVYGKRESEEGLEWIVASESVALTALGFEFVADVKPGEAIFINKQGKLFSQQCSENPQKRPCIFEYVYFSRPDSKIDEISVYKARMRMGSSLAKQIKEINPDHDIDVVIPIPDSSTTAANQLAVDLSLIHI